MLQTKNCRPEFAWKKWLMIIGVVLLIILCIGGCIACGYSVFQMWLMKQVAGGVADKLSGDKNKLADTTAATGNTTPKENPV